MKKNKKRHIPSVLTLDDQTDKYMYQICDTALKQAGTTILDQVNLILNSVVKEVPLEEVSNTSTPEAVKSKNKGNKKCAKK